VGTMASLAIHSNRKWASMGNVAISRFDTFTNSYRLALQQHRKEHIGRDSISCHGKC
jgi:hypothetical protein